MAIPRTLGPVIQARAQQLRRHGVALSEVADALAGTPDGPRLLVVDAASVTLFGRFAPTSAP